MDKQLEREIIRKELERARSFSGANFSKHFNRMRMTAPAPAPPVRLRPNPFKVWRDFSVMQIIFKIKEPSYRLQEVMKVRILDPSTLTYPIDFLKFSPADKNQISEYDSLNVLMNEVYTTVGEVNKEYILTNQYIKNGNVAIIMEHGVYKRAQILEASNPNDKYRRVVCYLVDEGIETVVRGNRIYRVVRSFWRIKARIMKFRLAGLRRYENTTEYRQLLINEFAVKPDGEDQWELSAQITSRKSDGYKIVLSSSKYPNQSINEIILRKLFNCFDMKTILTSTDFYPTVRLVGAQNNGNILLQLDTLVFRHLRELMTKRQDSFMAAQKTTDGFVEENESYIYWNPDKGTCFRVLCRETKTNDSKSLEVEALFIDHGTVHKVNRMRLAHLKYLGSAKLPFNLLAIIPPQSVIAHLAGIESMNLKDFNKLFDRRDSFYLRKTQKLGKKSSVVVPEPPEVELFADYLKNVSLGKSTSLNKLILGITAETQGQLISKGKPMTYCTRDFSSFAPVKMDGANWGIPNGKFVPLQVGEILDIIVVGDGDRGELFVRSAYAHSTALIDTIHKKCQSYLTDYRREESCCTCMMDGYHFVVETEYECTRLYRVRVTDRRLQPTVKVKDPQWDIVPAENRAKKVECLFLDRGEYRHIPVADLRVMNPAMAVYPAQGALAIWTCDDEYYWRHDEWKHFVKYAANRRFKAKVLTLTQDAFGRTRFEMNLYKIADADTSTLLRPKDRFWEPRKSFSKFNGPSWHKINKEKTEPIYYEERYPPSIFDV